MCVGTDTADGRGHVVRKVPRMDEQCPRHLTHFQPSRGQDAFAVAPGRCFVAPVPGRDGLAEPTSVAAITPPGRKPAPQVVVVLEHRPVHEPFGDLASGVDDESELVRRGDPVHAAFAAMAVMDARGREPSAYGERGNRVTCFVPGRPHRRLAGRRQARVTTAVIALADPPGVDDRLVVVADDAAKFGVNRVEGHPVCSREHSTADYAVDRTLACCLRRASDG